METNVDMKVPETKEYQVPEWEHGRTEEVSKGDVPGKTFRVVCLQKIDSIIPSHRRYLWMSRKIFLLTVGAAFLGLLALIIGLAVGLRQHSHKKDLPLPSNTQTFTGDFTYFEPGLGACGETDTSSDNIVAVSHLLFDSVGTAGGNPNLNPLCNKMLRAQRYDERSGGMKSVDLKVVDRCVGCALYDLDTSESAFAQLAPIPSGRVDVTWAWLQPVATGT